MLKAGAVAFDITPPVGIPLAGSFNERIATDIDDPLHARAVVLEDAAGPVGRVAIVSCDLVCMPGETVRATRELVAQAGSVPPERVLIAATHTHTAPAPTGLLGTRRADEYMDALPNRIATAIGMAASRLRPARAAWGTGREAGVSFNRRFRMRDGTVRMNPGRGNPDMIEPAGPIDPELGVLWIEGEAGAPIAAIASFVLHYVGTDNARHVSADYFGAYARWLQRIFGRKIVPVLLNGTSGDINNVDVHDPHQLGGKAQAERVAGVLAGETLRVVQRLRPSSDVTLGAAHGKLPFRRKAVTPEDLSVAEKIVAVANSVSPNEIRQHAGIGETGPFSWVVGQPLPGTVIRQYAQECLVLAQLPETLETEVQALRIGECAIVALPGEIFVQLGLAIKAQSPFGPHRTGESGSGGVTMMASLANDYIGYVPTHRAQLEEGGYETWAARSALPAAGTGEAMVDLSVDLLRSVSNGD